MNVESRPHRTDISFVRRSEEKFNCYLVANIGTRISLAIREGDSCEIEETFVCTDAFLLYGKPLRDPLKFFSSCMMGEEATMKPVLEEKHQLTTMAKENINMVKALVERRCRNPSIPTSQFQGKMSLGRHPQLYKYLFSVISVW